MNDPVGSTFGGEETARSGTISLTSPASGDDVSMEAMLKQMQTSVMAAAATTAASRSSPNRPPQRHHHSLSGSMRTLPTIAATAADPVTAPAAMPAATSGATSVAGSGVESGDEANMDMAQLFESLLHPVDHEPSDGCLHASNIIMLRDGEQVNTAQASTASAASVASAASSPVLGSGLHPPTVPSCTTTNKSRNLPPAEIPGRSVSGNVAASARPDWFDDAAVQDMLQARWLQLQQVWDIACQRMSRRVRACERVLADIVSISAAREKPFAPPHAVTDELLQELQHQFTQLVRQFTPREVVVWNVRKSLRDIAANLYLDRIPALPAWRDEVGTAIVQQLNKAIAMLSAQRRPPAALPVEIV